MSGRALKEFLNARRNKASAYTHTGMGDMRGKYYVKQEDSEQFTGLYKAGIKRGIPLSLTEAHRNYSPVFIDFDFKQASPERIYTKEHVKAVCLAIISELSKYVDCKDTELSCYVLEKAAPRTDKQHPFKDGFHLQFPDLITQTEVQHLVRNNLLESEALKGIFEGTTFLNSFDDVYDEAVIDCNPLMMYGSSKDGGESYKVSYCLEGTSGQETRCKESATKLVDRLSIRNKFKVKKVFEEKQAEVIALLEKKSSIKERMEAARQASSLPDDELPPDTAHICKLVKILDFDRAENFKKWFSVGAALHNTSRSLLPLWIEFSRQFDKFQEGECEKKWAQFKPGCGYGSLVFWARQDNPQKFEEIEQANMKERLANAGNDSDEEEGEACDSSKYEEFWKTRNTPGYQLLKELVVTKITHAHVAQIIQGLDPDHYLSKVKVYKNDTDIEILYPNDKGLWKTFTDIDTILLGFSHMIRKIEELIKELAKVEKDEAVASRLALLRKLVEKLENEGFASSVASVFIRKAAKRTADEGFPRDQFDSVSGYIGFRDGVYTFKDNRLLTSEEATPLYVIRSLNEEFADLGQIDP